MSGGLQKKEKGKNGVTNEKRKEKKMEFSRIHFLF